MNRRGFLATIAAAVLPKPKAEPLPWRTVSYPEVGHFFRIYVNGVQQNLARRPVRFILPDESEKYLDVPVEMQDGGAQ